MQVLMQQLQVVLQLIGLTIVLHKHGQLSHQPVMPVGHNIEE
jgi:hypothetical protein